MRSPARDAWELLFELFVTHRPRVPSVASEFGLSAAQCHALRLLRPARPVPMRRLAEALACDASNVTGIVDRLEARGLVERRPSPRDRRVKVLALTRSGRTVRSRLLARIGEPPAPIARLSLRDLRTLRSILRRVIG